MLFNLLLKIKKIFKIKKTTEKQDFSVVFDKRERVWFENKLIVDDFPKVNQVELIEYNQALNKYTKQWCFLYSFFTVISNIYGVKFSNNFFINKLLEAEKSGIYRVKSWAKFRQSFKWLSENISKEIGVKLIPYSTIINSDNFVKLLDKWYFFTLWTKKANKEYFEEIKDWDIDNLDYNSWTKKGHLQTYYKDLKTGTYYIIENYKWFIVDNTIEFDLIKLKQAVKKDMYYKTVRTIVPSWNNKNKSIFLAMQEKKNSNTIKTKKV